MAYQLVSSSPTVLVYSPTEVLDALICTIRSQPSGSVLVRTVPAVDQPQRPGNALLNSLADAVENILEAGVAVAATGTQMVEAGGLLADYVTFTVRYDPPYFTPGTIEGEVTIPVLTLTADTSILGGSTGFQSAPELIQAEYEHLATLAGG